MSLHIEFFRNQEIVDESEDVSREKFVYFIKNVIHSDHNM